MATQTRRTIRRSARFLRATVTASMVAACCGLILWSTVAAHAAAPYNGMPYNGMPFNGIGPNGMPFNGTPLQGMPRNGLPTQGGISNGVVINAPTVPAVLQESLPWSGLSQRALGKHQPPSCKGPLCRP